MTTNFNNERTYHEPRYRILVADAFETWLAFAKHRKRLWGDDKRLWDLWIKGEPTRSNRAGLPV